MRIYDLNGQERDWAWVANVYGQVTVTAASEYPAWEVVELREREGPAIYLVEVRSENGQPEAGVPVVRTWPGAPELPEDEWLTQHGEYGVHGMTNSDGLIGFGGGGGDYYNPADGPGPTDIWVGDGHSECICGLGFYPLTEHRRLDPVFQWMAVEEPEPPDTNEPDEPSPGFETEVLAYLAQIVGMLEQMVNG